MRKSHISTVTQVRWPAKGERPETVYYTTKDKTLNDDITGMGINIHAAHCEAFINMKDENAAEHVQVILATCKIKADLSDEKIPGMTATPVQLVIRNAENPATLRKLALIFGMMSASERPYSVDKDLCNQIIDHELKRGGKSASDVNFVTFTTAKGADSRDFLQANIQHPLSPVNALYERANTKATGAQEYVSVGVNSGVDETAIIEAIRKARITVNTPRDNAGHYIGIIAYAPVTKVSEALRAGGILPGCVADAIAERSNHITKGFADRVKRDPENGKERGV